MPHRFEDAARWAAVFDDPARDAWQRPEAVLAALALAPAMRVADLGAGTGYFTVRLARALPAGRVVATDVEPDMVRYLAARAAREGLGNVDVALATAEDPGLAPGSLDRVLVVDVWHHVPDRRRLAAQLAAALRPGGRVVVVDFTAAARQGPPPAHRLAPGAVADDLRGAGLEVSVAEDALPEQYVVTGTRR